MELPAYSKVLSSFAAACRVHVVTCCSERQAVPTLVSAVGSYTQQ